MEEALLNFYPNPLSRKHKPSQSKRANLVTNARKVISEVFASVVLQCIVFWRKSKHKTDVTA